MKKVLSKIKNKIDFALPDGMMVINRDKKIIAFSEAAQRLTGIPEEEVLSKEFRVLLGKSKNACKLIENSLITGKSFSNISLDIISAPAKDQYFIASLNPINHPDQGIIGVIVVFRNMDEMVALIEALEDKSKEILDEKNKLEAIFNSRLEGTFTINKDWVITSFNPAAERITGYGISEAIGRKCWEIFKSTLCRNGCHMELTMSELKSAASKELMIQHKRGVKVPLRINSAPLFDGAKNHIGGVETFQDISEIKNLSQQLEEHFRFENIIGTSKAMQKVYALMQNVIQSDSTVLISGESGTGKEIVARTIHLNSERKLAPFMAVNCSAFAETLLESELFGHEKGAFTGAIKTKPGRFELAGEGTLFLDEIGDLSLSIQVKLLRVLENRCYELVGGTKSLQLKARIITATNKDLDEEVKLGRFREDLYYRINVINIFLPPLRERLEDLSLLVNYFMDKFKKKFDKEIHSISSSAIRLMRNYEWPGNIRELENVLEHAFVVCQGKVIETEHLPERLWAFLEKSQPLFDDKSSASILQNAEKVVIKAQLEKHNGHRGKTAEALGIDKATLWRKMKKLGIQ
jgi:PAS domain S-box-containing protein